jgi:hypothetical protein
LLTLLLEHEATIVPFVGFPSLVVKLKDYCELRTRPPSSSDHPRGILPQPFTGVCG